MVGKQEVIRFLPVCPSPSQSTANSAGWETLQCRAPYLGLKSRLQGAPMTSLSRNARIAGLLYLTLLTAPLRLIYIPSKLFVAAESRGTPHNISAHPTPVCPRLFFDPFNPTLAILLPLAPYPLLAGSVHNPTSR